LREQLRERGERRRAARETDYAERGDALLFLTEWVHEARALVDELGL
jgi:hypothetical protein